MDTLFYTIYNNFYEAKLWEFMEYHSTGEYINLMDNPVFEEIQAIINCMNIANEYMEWPLITLPKEVKKYLKEK